MLILPIRESFRENTNIIALLLAALLDYLIADPRFLLHPVQLIGMVITYLSNLILTYFQKPKQRRFAGVGLGLILILGTGLISWLGLFYLNKYSPLLAQMLMVILLASCFAGRSLNQATQQVLKPLKVGDLAIARQQLSYFVGRDTQQLTEKEVLRATLESWAENSVDGVTAPLFYAIVGVFIPIIGPLPLALGYKAASTLDSMVGYLREPYTDLGWFSARFEDYLTWFPCRLTVLTLALLSGKPRKVLQICRRDAPHDPSPNSGWSEAIYAAILEVQLGGENQYQGVTKFKPLLGDDLTTITTEKITEAIALTRTCFLLWLAIAVVFASLISL